MYIYNYSTDLQAFLHSQMKFGMWLIVVCSVSGSY